MGLAVNVVVLWVCAGMVASVFAVMLYSVATFRRSSPGEIPIRHRRVRSEVLWALVPILIFILAAMPVVASIEASR